MKAQRRRAEIVTAAGLAIFLAAGGGCRLAQAQGDRRYTGEVVVTGLRKSIQDSINVKKEELVDRRGGFGRGHRQAAGRLDRRGDRAAAGIAAQRTNGRAQTLSIRGLGPDFTVTTFNGREQASINDNRTVEFDQYPSELVTQVKIYKTPDAGMAYQGIAGTTDIETVHPLAFSDRKLAFGYKREINEQEANVPGLPDAGDRVNATYIDQFGDNTLGIALGAAYNKTPYQAQTGSRGAIRHRPDVAHMFIGGDKDGVQSSFYKRTASWAWWNSSRTISAHGAGRLPLRLQGAADDPAHGIRHDLGRGDTDQPGTGRK